MGHHGEHTGGITAGDGDRRYITYTMGGLVAKGRDIDEFLDGARETFRSNSDLKLEAAQRLVIASDGAAIAGQIGEVQAKYATDASKQERRATTCIRSYSTQHTTSSSTCAISILRGVFASTHINMLCYFASKYFEARFDIASVSISIGAY